MLVNTYFFWPTTLAQLYGHDIYTPRSLWAGMQVEIVGGHLHQLLLLTYCHCLFWQAIGTAASRFDFYKDDILLIFSHQIDLTVGTAKILLTDTITAAHET